MGGSTRNKYDGTKRLDGNSIEASGLFSYNLRDKNPSLQLSCVAESTAFI